MRRRDLSVGLFALLLAAWSLWVLEGARQGVVIEDLRLGDTPMTRMSDGSGGPPVVIAHGFAGSRQMMQAYGLTLARAGYDVHAFDFLGHGRHKVPMGGDVTSVEGTTRLLVDQTAEVIAMARTRGDGAAVALLGHSMATDVLVRVAAETEGVGPLILLSPFSQAITATEPKDLLMIAGAWEARLSEFALEQVRQIDPEAGFGEVVGRDGLRRMALQAPMVEHVAILHSRAAQRATLDWLNGFHGRDQGTNVPPTGWALIGLLTAITALFGPVARLLPRRETPDMPLSARGLAVAIGLPALAAPLLATQVETKVLPVLVADYLALHLMIYGVLQLAVLGWLRGRPGWPAPLAAGLLVVWTLGVFGLALDRYGANFWPTPERLAIIAALCLGAVPFMLADSWLAHGAGLWRRVLARVGFLASLGIAVALDFGGLFFLLMIAPVIVLFFLSFGVMGRAVAQRSGPMAAGLGLGLALAWALGVSFPLFSA
jgi:pimeloyl-ACP methyl ester carboxylesterase